MQFLFLVFFFLAVALCDYSMLFVNADSSSATAIDVAAEYSDTSQRGIATDLAQYDVSEWVSLPADVGVDIVVSDDGTTVTTESGVTFTDGMFVYRALVDSATDDFRGPITAPQIELTAGSAEIRVINFCFNCNPLLLHVGIESSTAAAIGTTTSSISIPSDEPVTFFVELLGTNNSFTEVAESGRSYSFIVMDSSVGDITQSMLVDDRFVGGRGRGASSASVFPSVF